MATPELSGVSIVGAGTFNPAIIHPRWLAEKRLLPENLAEHAMTPGPQEMLVSGQLAVFVADWLAVQVTQEQAVFSTVDQGRELDLRDFATGVFELLPETPVDALGINTDIHFRTASEEAWHAFGDRFLPKDFWEPLFSGEGWKERPDGKKVGMRVMTVEAHREDSQIPGYVRVQLAPSVRVPQNGVYIGINAHFQLTTSESDRSNAAVAAGVIVDEWKRTRELESDFIAHLLEAV